MNPNRPNTGRNKHYTKRHTAHTKALTDSAESRLVRDQYRLNGLLADRIRICPCSCVLLVTELVTTLYSSLTERGSTVRRFSYRTARAPAWSATGSHIEVTPRWLLIYRRGRVHWPCICSTAPVVRGYGFAINVTVYENEFANDPSRG